VRLYLDTSVLGALLDLEGTRRVGLTRALLEAISARSHVGVISNFVQEELMQAPEKLRRAIRAEILDVEFELALEDEESALSFRPTNQCRSFLPDTATTCGTSPSRARAMWMRWSHGISVTS
jgi:predicted nucleic acid-binding protein